MEPKTIIGIALVALIAGVLIFLNIRNRKNNAFGAAEAPPRT